MRHSERIPITLSCKDCDYIPKIEDAGKIFKKEDGSEYQLMHNGVKIIKDCYHEFITEIIRCSKGHHEPQEEKIFYEVLKHVSEGSVMLELGSFWAYYSLWFHKEIPGAVNYMIEPNPIKLEIGKVNFRLNQFDQGYFYHGCVGDHYEKQVNFIDWDGKSYRMELWSVDTFLEAKEIEHLAILHSDIQGAEYDMLVGASESLQFEKIDHLFISTHGNNHQKCLDFLKKIENYEVLCSHTLEESFSGDGLIVASCKISKESIDYKISHRNYSI